MNRKQRRAAMKIAVSQCPIHGTYDKHSLCPCYEPGGTMAHLRHIYGTKAWVKYVANLSNKLEMSFCPIHGETTVSDKGIFQCGCFDEKGNKIVHLNDDPTRGDVN